MPIYEYRCAACGHHMDALQKFSEGPLRKCPECGRLKLKRLMSAPSFRLKGGGWYETDFKSDNEKKRNLVESSDAAAKKESAKDGDKQKADGAKKAKPAAADKSTVKEKSKRASTPAVSSASG